MRFFLFKNLSSTINTLKSGEKNPIWFSRTIVFYSERGTNNLRFAPARPISAGDYTGSFITERSKVSAFFIEKYLYFIETFYVILFTIEVHLVICPYFSQKEI